MKPTLSGGKGQLEWSDNYNVGDLLLARKGLKQSRNLRPSWLLRNFVINNNNREIMQYVTAQCSSLHAHPLLCISFVLTIKHELSALQRCLFNTIIEHTKILRAETEGNEKRRKSDVQQQYKVGFLAKQRWLPNTKLPKRYTDTKK